MTEDFKTISASSLDKSLVLGAAVAATGVVAFVDVPANAQSTGGIADINAMVTSLGTIAAGVTTVILGAMVVRLGIKFVNRMTVKG